MKGGRGIGNNKNLKRLQTRDDIDTQAYNQNGFDKDISRYILQGCNFFSHFFPPYLYYESSHYIENLDRKSFFFISVIYYGKSDNQKPTRFILWYMKIKGMYYSNLFILILLIATLFYILPLLQFFKRFEEFQKEFKNLLDISDKIVSDIEIFIGEERKYWSHWTILLVPWCVIKLLCIHISYMCYCVIWSYYANNALLVTYCWSLSTQRIH